MAVISREGARRRRKSKKTVISAVGVAVVMAAIAVWALTGNTPEPGSEAAPAAEPALAPRGVAVLLPDRLNGPVMDNAALQWEGFEAAFNDHTVSTSLRITSSFDYPLSEEAALSVMDQMESWYAQGVRTFIITMSGAVMDNKKAAINGIKDRFIEWRRTIANEDDRPVLIATVASAPGIAAGDDGVLRHYIRSEDESDVLAGYVEAHNATEVYVVYVDDAYGQSARDILLERIRDNTASSIHNVNVLFDDTHKEALRTFLDDIPQNSTSGSNAVVVVIGYGKMIQHALLTLQNSSFAGRTLVVSTLTEQQWRPEIGGGEANLRRSFAERVFTISPVPIAETVKATNEQAGAVVQFAYLTLDRALDCRDVLGVTRFYECWNGNDGKPLADRTLQEVPGVKVELTQQGDSHVSLRLVSLPELED